MSENGKKYLGRSATRFIELNGENYFDNAAILEQFERLFQLLEFKTDYLHHVIDILVDNATTHTAKQYTVSSFRKGIGYSCPVDQLEWKDDNNNNKKIKTRYKNGDSKGLFEICKELGLIPKKATSAAHTLPRLQELALNHPAFESKTFLSELASKYSVNIIYLPKFHCELSPIEGVWAHQKQHIRKNTDQSFDSLRKLLVESRNNLRDHVLIPKLWRRFWRTIDAYRNGNSFVSILTEFFGVKCEEESGDHRRIGIYANSTIQL